MNLAGTFGRGECFNLRAGGGLSASQTARSIRSVARPGVSWPGAGQAGPGRQSKRLPRANALGGLSAFGGAV
jgi:hypothetical protein